MLGIEVDPCLLRGLRLESRPRDGLVRCWHSILRVLMHI